MGGTGDRAWASRVAGLLFAAANLIVAFTHHDVEAAAFAVLTAAAALLTIPGRGLVGRIALVLVSLDTLAWMVPAVFVNVGHAERIVDVGLPAVLAGGAVAVLLVAVGAKPRVGTGIGMALAAVAVASTAFFQGQPQSASSQPTDARVTMRNLAFSPKRIGLAQPTAVVEVTNRDLFWHTFSVRALKVNVSIPTGASRRVVLRDVAPGTYRYVCRIPGHEGAGMTGTLTVTAGS